MEGARHTAKQIEITDDSQLFYARTGLIFSYLQLEKIGFQMESFSGFFTASRLDELFDFCKREPSYHIISIARPGRYENRYISSKKLYYLGDGDKNPELVLDLFLRKSSHEVIEEGLAKAFAVIFDRNRSEE